MAKHIKAKWKCGNCGAPEPVHTIWDGKKGSKICCEHCKTEPKNDDYNVLIIYDKI